MSSILTDFYEKIRQQISISEVVRTKISLTRRGQEFTGLCPFHGEKTPSFTVNDIKKFYHCFGCGAHGDTIKFLAETSGYSYKDAAYKLAEDHNIPLPKFSKEKITELENAEKVMMILQQAAEFYRNKLEPSHREYLQKRGVDNHLIDLYQIGYTGNRSDLISFLQKKNISPQDLIASGLMGKNTNGSIYEVFRNRIIIPIKNNFGKIIGFGARALGDELPKYINSPETIVFKKNESLYGEDIATGAAYKANRVILVEGYFDVISLQANGFKETVASLGTAVTTNQLQRLWKIADEIIVCLDGDQAGLRASSKVIDNALPLISPQHKISFIALPQGVDPDELIKKQGKVAFEQLINNRKQLSEYIIEITTNGKEFNVPEERAELEQLLQEYTVKVKDEILNRNIKKYFKDKCWELFNSKKFFSKRNQLGTQLHSSNLIKSSEQENELENIEQVILALIIMNAHEYLNESTIRVFEEVAISNNKLADFIEFLLALEPHLTSDSKELEKVIKNSRFNELFNLLYSKYKMSIFSSLLIHDPKVILEYLLAKRYLIKLTNEYHAIMRNTDLLTEERILFYVEQIRQTQEKIEFFNQNYSLINR